MGLFKKKTPPAPKTGYVLVDGSRALRYLTGKNAGKIVPQAHYEPKEQVCARCTLPSYSGLPPFITVMGFNPKTGEAIEQYVHEQCPRDPAKQKAAIAKFAEVNAKFYAEFKKLTPPRHSPSEFMRMFSR
jgi:hypothetical protein